MSDQTLITVVFAATYLGMALGRVPGLKLDRTGIALMAAAVGVRLGFADFARAGVPMTLISMALAALWLGLGGWMPWR